MMTRLFEQRYLASLGVLACVLGGVFVLLGSWPTRAQEPARDTDTKGFAGTVKPLLQKFCLDCHSTKAKKGSLDLERFATLDLVRKDLKPWQQTIEMLEAGEMPPVDRPQPSATERKRLITWIRDFLDAEARARSGDPGRVPLRRLSNAEYDATIRDLTGVDLRPAREFPADGAGGEGFSNAAESLSDISPALLTKYLNAAKAIAEHAVLLPDGIRFSPARTRRDWIDESLVKLRTFYATCADGEGHLPLASYLRATVRHREVLLKRTKTIEEVAKLEKLRPKYLRVVWQTLTEQTPSYPLEPIRARWRSAGEKDVPALVADIAAWQKALWKVVRVGSYMHLTPQGYRESTSRQVPNEPAVSDSRPVNLAYKPVTGQNDVTLYLVSRNLTPGDKRGKVLWSRPRFEGAGKPTLLLRDYASYGPAHEVDYASAFASAPGYLAAVVESASHSERSVEDLARKHGLDAAWLKQWIAVLDLDSLVKAGPGRQAPGKSVPAVKLELLEEPTPKVGNGAAINGWRRKGAELPILVSNASNRVEKIPGTVPPHKVAVHPTPGEFVAVAWKSPMAGTVGVAAHVIHAHPACGNGVAWWIEHRRGSRATVHAEGVIELGGEAKTPGKTLPVEKDDLLLLAVDARNRDHICDLTEIAFTVTETGKGVPGKARTWDLATDVADTVLAGNPHADRLGNKDTWSFVRGPARSVGNAAQPTVPTNSVLGRWREAASNPARQVEATKLAGEVQRLLTGKRPGVEKSPDRILYDNLVSVDGALFQGIDLSRLSKPRTGHGLPRERFGGHQPGQSAEEASLVADASSVIEVHLPAALFRDRAFVVEGRLLGSPAGAEKNRVVQFEVLTTPPGPAGPWDGTSPVVAVPGGKGYRDLLAGLAEFRRCFPLFLCFPPVVPTDEVVSLKMFHREDEPLLRLFLDDIEKQQLERLWQEHRFISQQPIAENKYLPLFIGFVTQDQPKEMLAYFESQRSVFKQRADAFEKELEAAIPGQMDALVDLAARAFRRPLSAKQKTELLGLYQPLRSRGVGHEEAVRGMLARILVSPAFLFRIEKAPPGEKPGAVDAWELACRLSYFLTSSSPDAELRRVAANGSLSNPDVLAAQTRRLLAGDQARALAIEFGTQWIHVRGFDELKEKNEKLFPTFDANLRQAIYEESILFFQDLFQADRPVTHLLDADATFLDERLARHYSIPGVTGPAWRRVTGVRKYGRGGILGLASVQARQSGASRTSPVLRGNWVVETLLGEKLPRPPANVPQLPEEEGKDRLTMRQLVEKHASVPSCAVCHQRIDPFGFALEHYDPIGRRRDRDLGGLPIDAGARLRDGTTFEGISGLREYLLTRKKDVIVRLFCRKLLGYALGRSVTLSDQALLDQMVAELNSKDGRVSAAVLAIVKSQQFRMIRGSAFHDE